MLLLDLRMRIVYDATWCMAEQVEIMEDDRLKRTRELLLQAVEAFRDISTTSQASVSNQPLVNASNTLLGSGSGGSATRPDAMTSELNRLFNFGFWKKASSLGLKVPKSKKKHLNA